VCGDFLYHALKWPLQLGWNRGLYPVPFPYGIGAFFIAVFTHTLTAGKVMKTRG